MEDEPLDDTKIPFDTKGETSGKRPDASWVRDGGGSRKRCLSPQKCPSKAYIEERLEEPTAPVATRGVCASAAPELCTVSTATASTSLKTCVEGLLGRGELGRIEGDEIALTGSAAYLVAESALSNNIADVAIENSRILTAIAVSAMGAWALASKHAIDDASYWCDRLAAGDIDAKEATRALTCMSHATTTAVSSGVLATWPGCACGERGRLLGDVCVEGRSVTRPFAEWPIDARLPDALTEALTRARAVLAERGWTLRSVGILGCQIVRFERGGDVPALASATSPRLRAGQISGHSAGAACDLVNAWVDLGPDGRVLTAGYSVEMAFWHLADPEGHRNASGRTAFLHDLQRRAAKAGGEGPFFRAYVKDAAPYERGSEAAYVFAVLRNALVDAGFVVNTPATNAIHYNHLHFHLPPTDAIWKEMSDDATPSERREQLIEAMRPGADGRSRAVLR